MRVEEVELRERVHRALDHGRPRHDARDLTQLADRVLSLGALGRAVLDAGALVHNHRRPVRMAVRARPIMSADGLSKGQTKQ